MNDEATSDADREQQLNRIIADYAFRIDAGEQVDRAALLGRYSDLADQLSEHFADLDAAERWRQLAQPDNALLDTDVYRTMKATTPSPDAPAELFSDSAMPLDQRSGDAPFGRYQVEKTLGSGAMGEVYRALDTKLQRQVALKVPKREQNSNTELMERFLNEAQSAAKLSHRNLCPVYDTGAIDGCHYITMALVKGKPLSAFIQPDREIAQRTVAHLVRKLALALTAAHKEGVIHRDLKPDNIMVDQHSEPVIMDFGLARQLGGKDTERLSVNGAVIGTPAYMAPEQTLGDTSHASDIYSLGVIFYELLTGKLPLKLSGSLTEIVMQISGSEPCEPTELRPDLDSRLREICLKMMAKQIEDRYDSMEDVAAALTKYLKSSSKQTTSETATVKKDDEALAQLFATTTPGAQSTRATTTQLKPPVIPPPRSDATRLSHVRASISDAWQNVPPTTRWTAAAAMAGMLMVLAIVIFIDGDRITVRVDIDEQLLADGTVTLTVANQELEIAGLGETIKLRPGTHHFEVLRGDSRIKADEFTVVKNGDNVLRISILDGPVPSWPRGTTTATSLFGPNAPSIAKATFDEAQARAHQQAWADYLDVPVKFTNSIGMKFSLIPPGEFLMGSPESSSFAGDSEKPQHWVRITKPFYISTTEVTQEQYELITGKNPSSHTDRGQNVPRAPRASRAVAGKDTTQYPVESVTWAKAVSFCVRLGATEDADTSLFGNYSLPTEAQWEYACRAGSSTEWHFGDDINRRKEYVSSSDGLEGGIRAVGVEKPNAFGLYDMHGNVSEWCADWYGPYDAPTLIDPIGPAEGTFRVHRGGPWSATVFLARSAAREANKPKTPTTGFRVVRAISAKPNSAELIASDRADPPRMPTSDGLAGLVHTFEGHIEPLHCASFSSDGRRILSGTTQGGGVRLWDVESGELLKHYATRMSWCTSVLFLRGGKQAVLASSPPGQIWILDLESGDVIHRMHPGKTGHATRLALTRDGTKFTGISSRSVRVWEVDDWAKLSTFSIKSATRQQGRAVSSDGKHALIGSESGELVLWELTDGNEVRRFKVHDTAIYCVDISPDAKRAVSGDTNGTIVLSDLETGTEIRRFSGQRSTVHCVRFSPDGLTVLSSGGCQGRNSDGALRTPNDDYAIRLWDVETGREITHFDGHRDTVRHVEFSTDGRFALSASWDKTARLWRLPED
ncbi:MAG: SUMF1/EgtB/PvdO family nonheme iron enzyme [Planctomycetes bacterium]|nr:SUMF1/EgtB/PvdO family nonheme iron enzyme [Planctomycetota bacterium]